MKIWTLKRVCLGIDILDIGIQSAFALTIPKHTVIVVVIGDFEIIRQVGMHTFASTDFRFQ